MNVESVTVKVSQKVSAHVIDKLRMIVESAAVQVLLNHSAIVMVEPEIVKVLVVELLVLINVESVKVMVSQ